MSSARQGCNQRNSLSSKGWRRGQRSTAIELRSADFSPPHSSPPQTAGSGLKSALRSCRNWLNSTPLGQGRGGKLCEDSPLLGPLPAPVSRGEEEKARFNIICAL